MPIYEYECIKGCPNWEEIQKVSDEDIKQCPKCKKKSAKKLISAGNFRLVGEGFYKRSSEE
jgi:putative FmdB family regulatory protein